MSDNVKDLKTKGKPQPYECPACEGDLRFCGVETLWCDRCRLAWHVSEVSE